MECYHSWCSLIVSLRMDEGTGNKMVIIGVIVGTLVLTSIIIITNIFLACRRARQATLRAQAQAQAQNASDSHDDQTLEPQSASVIASRRRLRSSPLPYFNTQPPAVIRMQRAQNIPGLTLQELNLVAPIKPFVKTLRESHDHNKDVDHEEENTCAVCLEEMKNDATVREMPNCGHIFNSQYVIQPCRNSSTNTSINFTNYFCMQIFLFFLIFIYPVVSKNGQQKLIAVLYVILISLPKKNLKKYELQFVKDVTLMHHHHHVSEEDEHVLLMVVIIFMMQVKLL